MEKSDFEELWGKVSGLLLEYLPEFQKTLEEIKTGLDVHLKLQDLEKRVNQLEAKTKGYFYWEEQKPVSADSK